MIKQLRIERFLGGVSLIDVDVISEKENKVLIKTWDGFKLLESNGKFYQVVNEYKEIPEEWKSV
jgi:Neuraminidase (sialidase)